MLKQFIGFVVLLLLPWYGHAQDSSSAPRLQIYGRGGGNIGFFTRTQPHLGFMVGFEAGASARYSLSDKFSITGAPLYHQTGGSTVRLVMPNTVGGSSSDLLATYSQTSRVTIRSFQTEVAGTYSLGGADWRPFVKAGAAFNYVLSVSELYDRSYIINGTTNGVISTATGINNASSLYNRYYISGLLGAGFHLNAGEKTVVIEGGFNFALTPVSDAFSYINRNDVSGKLLMNSVSLNVQYPLFNF